MRLAISNIAWDREEDLEIADLLTEKGIDAIDVAPGKYFPDPAKATQTEIASVRRWWAERGIEITGMQALLFGTTGLNVFGDAATQAALMAHLTAVCRVGSGLGATRLVFGSPKNRDRSGLSDEEALEHAVPFFRRLGDIAASYGVVICLEPNPACYGANFMMTSVETAHVVRQVAHPAIGMQLDTGALHINCEDAAAAVREYVTLIRHVHASEPELVPLGDGGTDHASIAKAVQKFLPDHVVTIEMVATKIEPHLQSIKRALDVAINHYRSAI